MKDVIREIISHQICDLFPNQLFSLAMVNVASDASKTTTALQGALTDILSGDKMPVEDLSRGRFSTQLSCSK